MSDFKSYWYVCTSCDASIEVVSKGIHFQDPTCNCANSQVVWCQTNVVESDPTNERKQMQTAPYEYNPNALVTVKKIVDGEATYPTLKVVDLEGQLYVDPVIDVIESHSNGTHTTHLMKRTDIMELFRHRGFHLARIESQEKQLGQIIDNLTVDNWYNPNTTKEEVLSELCEILGHEAKQDVTITATVQVEVTYACPIEDVEDFDAKYFLQDNLTIDSYHGDLIVESFDVEDADVNW